MKKIWNEWGNTIIIGSGIIALALVLRIVNLTYLPIFGDEAIYIRWAQVMGAEPGLRFLPLLDGKQPFFMWVLMFLVRRFADPLFIGRLTSVFYGMGTLIGIFALSFYLFKSKKIAFVASLFWAISPYSVFYDRLALVDSMLTMFTVWTLFFGVLTSKTKRLDFAMLAGFALGGALLTKSPALFLTVLLPTTWIISNWPKRGENRSFGKKQLVHLIKLSFLYSVSLVIGYGMYNILRLGENFQQITLRNQDYIYPISHLWTAPLSSLVPNTRLIFDWLWRLGPGVLVIFITIVLIENIRRYKYRQRAEIALLFVWSAIPLFVSALYARVFTARYILFTLPTIYIFASLVFLKLFEYKESTKKILVVGLIIYVFFAFKSDYLLLTQPKNAPLPRVIRSGYLEEWTSGVGIYEVSEIIREEYIKEPEKKIVVGTEGYFGTLPDALQAYLNDLSEITVIGVGQPIREIPRSLVESKGAGNKTYLVINSSRLLTDPDNLGLELLAVYPKAFRPDGSRETLLFFQVTDKALGI